MIIMDAEAFGFELDFWVSVSNPAPLWETRLVCSVLFFRFSIETWLVAIVIDSLIIKGKKKGEMQDQLVCHGCRNTLVYPRGATNVRCALCNTINMVPHHPPPPHHHHGIILFSINTMPLQLFLWLGWVLNTAHVGMDMAHIVCGGCRTMLMYTRGANSVRCSCCQTVNLVPGISIF